MRPEVGKLVHGTGTSTEYFSSKPEGILPPKLTASEGLAHGWGWGAPKAQRPGGLGGTWPTLPGPRTQTPWSLAQEWGGHGTGHSPGPGRGVHRARGRRLSGSAFCKSRGRGEWNI